MVRESANAGAQNEGAAQAPSSFQSAALPTELPDRAMQQNNLAGLGGRWQWECLPLFPRNSARSAHRIPNPLYAPRQASTSKCAILRRELPQFCDGHWTVGSARRLRVPDDHPFLSPMFVT